MLNIYILNLFATSIKYKLYWYSIISMHNNTNNYMEFFMRQFFVIFTMFFIQFDLYGANHSVKMLNQGSSGVMVFEPAYIKINIGDSVTFESTDAAHNSASIPGMIPSSASSWNGG